MVKLTEYELERQANIARNRALLEELDLKEAAAAIGISAQLSKGAGASKPKPVQPAKRLKRERAEDVQPRRMSARLRKQTDVEDPNESPSKRRKRLAEAEKRRKEEEEDRLAEEERRREASRPRHHNLELDAIVADADPEDVEKLTPVLELLRQTPHPRRAGNPTDWLFEGAKEKEEGEVQALREKLQKMKVVSRAKVTENRIYSAAYHPETSKDIVFFGDKHGQLGIWDAQAPAEEAADEDGDITASTKEGGKYWRLQPHWPATAKSSLSCIKFDPLDAHSVFTSSYDCTIRSTSFSTGVSREVFTTDDVLISSFDLPPVGGEMWISDTSAGLTHIDLRESKTRARRWELSTQKIGCVSVNPSCPTTLITASNERKLKMWDTRMLFDIPLQTLDHGPSTPKRGSKAKAVKPPPVHEIPYSVVEEYNSSSVGAGTRRGEWEHKQSVSAAYWDPRGRSIVSTSYDNNLRLWDISQNLTTKGTLRSFRPFCHISHDCQTGRWVTILKAQWSPNPDVYPHFTIGNMNRSVDIFTHKGELLTKLSNSSLVSAVQAVTCSHPSIVERVATGNASGRCVLWAPKE